MQRCISSKENNYKRGGVEAPETVAHLGNKDFGVVGPRICYKAASQVWRKKRLQRALSVEARA